MNLVLLFEEDFETLDAAATEAAADDAVRTGVAHLRGRRLRHLRKVLRTRTGDTLQVGLADAGIGTARVVRIDAREATLEVSLEKRPPPPLAASLVLALPRPPVLGRVLAAAASFGVKQIVLLHSRRVEKTYWQASALAPERLRHKLVLGLEQARDTVLPRVELARSFRDFSDEGLPRLLDGAHGFVAHTSAVGACPARLPTPAVVAVGPEGGFLDEEVARLCDAGMQPAQIGLRALRVETAVAALLSRVV